MLRLACGQLGPTSDNFLFFFSVTTFRLSDSRHYLHTQNGIESKRAIVQVVNRTRFVNCERKRQNYSLLIFLQCFRYHQTQLNSFKLIFFCFVFFFFHFSTEKKTPKPCPILRGFYSHALMTMTMINYSKIDGILFDATECSTECKAPTPQTTNEIGKK